jgi:hypothetical protein
MPGQESAPLALVWSFTGAGERLASEMWRGPDALRASFLVLRSAK